jgi:hypothetical protein
MLVMVILHVSWLIWSVRCLPVWLPLTYPSLPFLDIILFLHFAFNLLYSLIIPHNCQDRDEDPRPRIPGSMVLYMGLVQVSPASMALLS